MKVRVKVRVKSIAMEGSKFRPILEPIEQETRHGKVVFKVDVSLKDEKEDGVWQKWFKSLEGSKRIFPIDLKEEDFFTILLPLPPTGTLEPSWESRFINRIMPHSWINREMWIELSEKCLPFFTSFNPMRIEFL